jgi:hypothetical protein
VFRGGPVDAVLRGAETIQTFVDRIDEEVFFGPRRRASPERCGFRVVGFALWVLGCGFWVIRTAHNGTMRERSDIPKD